MCYLFPCVCLFFTFFLGTGPDPLPLQEQKFQCILHRRAWSRSRARVVRLPLPILPLLYSGASREQRHRTTMPPLPRRTTILLPWLKFVPPLLARKETSGKHEYVLVQYTILGGNSTAQVAEFFFVENIANIFSQAYRQYLEYACMTATIK